MNFVTPAPQTGPDFVSQLRDDATAAHTASQVARPRSGLLSFQPLWELVTAQEPDLLD
jgi:hypothetical protein